MAVDDEAFTRIHVHAFASLHIYDLEGSQALYFHHAVSLEAALHYGNDRGDETLCDTAVDAVLLCQHSRQFAQI